MKTVLVDSNVLIDVLTDDPHWGDWSAEQIERLGDDSILAVNPIIYAEVSIGFECIEELEDALPSNFFARLPLPWEAGFLAGKCFLEYRRSGGLRRSPLPDFFIGAHAAISGLRLLTRDGKRYRSYFPRVVLVTPELDMGDSDL